MTSSTHDPPIPFTDEEINELTGIGEVIRRPSGSVLIGDGEHTNFAFYLLKGHVKVVVAPEGRTVELRGPGHLVGEMAILRDRPRSASVVAITDLEALYLPGAKWHEYLLGHPQVTLRIAAYQADRLIEANRKKIESLLGAEQRLAKLLVELRDMGLGKSADDAVTLRFSQRELADIANLSRESVVQVIRRLKAAGVVSTGKQSTTIRDSELLSRIADGLTTADRG